MKCNCGGETSVTDSRQAEPNAIRRRRQCDDCGKRFTTWETRCKPDTRDRTAYFATRYANLTDEQKIAMKLRRAGVTV